MLRATLLVSGANQSWQAPRSFDRNLQRQKTARPGLEHVPACTPRDSRWLGHQAGFPWADCAPGMVPAAAGVVKWESLPDVCNHL
jgi:hypothetical protein